MSIASFFKDRSDQKTLSIAQNLNVMLPRMLQRRNAVSAESSLPGTFDDDKFVIQSYPKSQAQRSRIQDILSGIVLFQGVSDSIMKDLVGGFYETKYNNGDKIIVQGDIIAERFFLLESGQCDIFIQKGSADPFKVHTVLPGGFFGELALLYNAPRAATVISNGESKLWALDRGTFKNCMARAAKTESKESSSSLLKAVPKTSVLPTQIRGSLALMDEQVMKALDEKGKDSVKMESIPGWHTIVNMSINGDKFHQMLFKFNHPHISLYKLSDMDATNLETLLHPEVEPRHVIFLPMCKLLPTAVPNAVSLEGHHLDGTITFKFTLSNELSKFHDFAEKSKAIHSMLNTAYQNVRYVSAGGNIQEIETADGANPNFYGVGLCIDISKNGSSLTVREIVPGSPAAACGLISVHDHLIKIDGLSAKHSCPTLEDVVKLIRGIEGTKVKLQFRKSSGPKAKSIYDVTLIRGPNVTKLESVEEDLSSVEDSEHHISVGTVTEPTKEHLTSQKFQNAAAAVEQEKAPWHHESDNATEDYVSNLPDDDSLQDNGGLNNVRTRDLHSSADDFSNRGSRTASKMSSRSQSPFDDRTSQSSARLPAPSLFHMRQIAREEINRQIIEDGISFSQDPPKLSESDQKVSRYLQTHRSATVHHSSQNDVNRPIHQVFATNMGITLMSTHDDRYQVHSIASNAPASAHHVCIGDLLWAIDREPVASKSKEEICRILSRPNTDVHLSLCRNGTNLYMIVRRQVHQPSYNPTVRHLVSSTTNYHSRPNVAMSIRTDTNRTSQRLTARPSPHAFAKDSLARLLSSGFSVNKSTVGSVVVTSISSSDIRRMDVDDVIAAVDGHFFSPEDTLDDIAWFLEEPSGTLAHVTLLRDSGGTSGVMRKTTQFLRTGSSDENLSARRRDVWPFPARDLTHRSGNSSPIVRHPDSSATSPVSSARQGVGTLDHPYACHEAFLREAVPPNFPPHAYINEANDDNCSEYSDPSTSGSSSSSLLLKPSSADGAGLGLAFSFQRTPFESSFYVDYILPNSPADSCGQINVGDKLIKINGRSTSVEASMESFLNHMAGPEGSQVVLKFVKPDSDMKYSITLTRSPLILHHENALPIFNRNSEYFSTPRLPSQVIPESEPSSGHPPPPPPLLPPPSLPPRSSAQGALHEAVPTPSAAQSFETNASTFAKLRAERDRSIDFNSAFRQRESVPVAATQASKTKFSFKDMFYPSNISRTSV